MSQERIEIVRKGIEAWNGHDIDLGLSYLAEDVEWKPASPAAVERSVYRATNRWPADSPGSGRAGTSSVRGARDSRPRGFGALAGNRPHAWQRQPDRARPGV